MKNREGFTLIELIAVIIILGLVLIIAIPFFTGSLKEFRNDYYECCCEKLTRTKTCVTVYS